MIAKGGNKSKWANQILSLQQEDGSWGYFHTLSQPTPQRPMTTEQALRRLAILGYTIQDRPIQKAVAYMKRCLSGQTAIPDRREHWRDWNLYQTFMLAAWIQRFIPNDAMANGIASDWASVIKAAFEQGRYDHEAYLDAFKAVFGMSPHNGRDIDFVTFYQVYLLCGHLDETIEAQVLDYILNHPTGIYYIYPTTLSELPQTFPSLDASRYLGAIELLAGYGCAREKLKFVKDWLLAQRNTDGGWDMGVQSKDGVYFPLSDSWRNRESRKADCTQRISALLVKLS